MTDKNIMIESCINDIYRYLEDMKRFEDAECYRIADWALDSALEVFTAVNNYYTKNIGEINDASKLSDDLDLVLEDIQKEAKSLKSMQMSS